MRIHSLQLVGIGPYRDEVCINFDGFKSGKFLISGDTGSGKSMLIDAIYFGLYGSITSGNALAEARLRSRLCGPKDPSSVSVVFSTSAGIYKVTRTPRFWREKLRGGGQTDVKATAQLFKLAQPDDPGGDALVTGARDVGLELAQILPLTREQFLQTIVLPQGHFEKFLMAPSDERKEVLQTVFGTEIYRRFEAEVDRRAKEAAQDAQQRWNSVEAIAGNLGNAATVDQLKASDVRARDLVLASTDNWLQLLAASTELSIGENFLKEEEAAATAQLERATERNALIARRSEYLTKYFAQARDFDAAATARYRLQRDRQAAPVAAAEKALQRADTQLTAAKAAVAKDADAQPLSLAAAEEQVSCAQERVTKLEQQEKRFQERETVVREVAQTTEKRQELSEAIARNTEALEQHTGKLQAIEKEVAQLSNVTKELDEAQLRLTGAQQQTRDCKEYAEQVELCERLEKEQAARATQLQTATAAYQRIDALWVADTAALLALTLTPEGACPVCGSVEHPHPAVADSPVSAQDAGTDTTETVSLADRLEAAKAVEYARANLDNVQTQLSREREKLAALTPPENSLAAAIAAEESLQEELANIRKQLQRLRRLAKKQEEQQLELEQLRAALAAPQQQLQQIETRLAQLQGRLTALEQELAETATVQSLSEGAAENALLLHTAKKELENARAAHTSVHRFHAAAKQYAQAKEELLDTVSAQGFADIAAARAAQLAPARRRKLEENAASARQERQALRAELHSSALTAVKTAQPVELGSLKHRLETLREALRACSITRVEYQTRERAAAQQRQQLRIAIRDWKQARAANAVLLRLYSLVTNKNGDSGYGMPLSTWVLTQRLDEVLEVASPKLARMSEGKFQFRRTDSDASRHSDQGLSVGIYVSDQDRTVHPGSLSGGETFMASLALALALIEVVQAEAGGVSIGTMFIDEGFGTLDSNKLATVLQQLHDETEKDRTVGIISHVQELKNSISDRIEVHNDGHGRSWVVVRD